jgi:hypothetical protein
MFFFVSQCLSCKFMLSNWNHSYDAGVCRHATRRIIVCLILINLAKDILSLPPQVSHLTAIRVVVCTPLKVNYLTRPWRTENTFHPHYATLIQNKRIRLSDSFVHHMCAYTLQRECAYLQFIIFSGNLQKSRQKKLTLSSIA